MIQKHTRKTKLQTADKASSLEQRMPKRRMHQHRSVCLLPRLWALPIVIGLLGGYYEPTNQHPASKPLGWSPMR